MRFGRGALPNGFLPVFSVDTEDEARALIVMSCPMNLHGEYIARELAEEQTLENLQAFSDRLAQSYAVMQSHKRGRSQRPTAGTPTRRDKAFMKLCILTVALSLTPSLLSAQTIKPLLVTLSLLRATDATLTRDLAHRYGGHEQNPTLPQNQRAISAILAGETIAQVWALDKLNRTHPRIAKVIAWGSIGIEGWVIQHNAQQYGGR